MKLTITEALADIKTSLARIKKKRDYVMNLLARDSRLRDPLEAEGGSKAAVRRELQSIADLSDKIIRYRSAIQKANHETKLKILNTERSIQEWLNWRRELSEKEREFFATMANRIKSLRDQALARGQMVKEAADNAPVSMNGDLLVAISEADLQGWIEETEQVLGELDGKLSLLNATTLIEVG